MFEEYDRGGDRKILSTNKAFEKGKSAKLEEYVVGEGIRFHHMICCTHICCVRGFQNCHRTSYGKEEGNDN